MQLDENKNQENEQNKEDGIVPAISVNIEPNLSRVQATMVLEKVGETEPESHQSEVTEADTKMDSVENLGDDQTTQEEQIYEGKGISADDETLYTRIYCTQLESQIKQENANDGGKFKQSDSIIRAITMNVPKDNVTNVLCPRKTTYDLQEDMRVCYLKVHEELTKLGFNLIPTEPVIFIWYVEGRSRSPD